MGRPVPGHSRQSSPFNQWQWTCATVTQPSIKKGKSTKVQTDVACDFSSHSLFLLASVRKTQARGSQCHWPAKAELLLVCNQNIICSIYKRHNKCMRLCRFFFLSPLLREQLFFSYHRPDSFFCFNFIVLIPCNYFF